MKSCERTGTETERWIRIPSRGCEPNSGLHRSHIYEILHAGEIRTANILKPGARKGIRLVWLPSLLAYVEKHVEKIGRTGAA